MLTNEKLRPATFKHIEAELYAFHDTKREIRRLREEIIFGVSNDDENVGGGRSSEPGRPTERIATRLTTNRRLRNLEEIEQAIEATLNQVPEECQKTIRLKYLSNRKMPWEAIADKVPCHRTTAIRYRRNFIELVAEKIGWV